ncbi:DUF4915 domain-containing protein [Streptomyces sp. NPDC006658]|uniref:DUF4915 domain-containing protein n=1 Tax=Streptomyces sp. NPDC006658 TaxID=3156900 RepID=UPI0033F82E08
MTGPRNTVRPASLAGLLPPGRQLLASCFDAHHTIGGGLFAVDHTVTEIDRVSSTGLDLADGLLYRCLWSAEGSPAELVVYDTTGVLRYHRLDDVSTPHDILVSEGRVLVAATTQNEVRCVAPDGATLWRWRAPGETDSWHLNSLARYGERVAVCGFGPFLRRRGWDENGKPASGRVVALDTGEPLLEGLRAPHNPWYADGTWLVCDSASGELLEIADATRKVTRRLALPGWPRGLAVTDRYVFVGLSPHRHAASSVETAAVAAVDRAGWSLAALVDLPAREVYALGLAPTALVAAARRGFGANRTRTHEQDQRGLFERLGRSPARLWAIGDPLPESGRRATVRPAEPSAGETRAEPGALLSLECLVRNEGTELLTPAPPHPVRVVHRWYDSDGAVVTTGRKPIRAELPRSLPPDDTARVLVRARVPDEPGRYVLRLTLAQDGHPPFDETDASGALDLPVRVTAEDTGPTALAPFAIGAARVRAARAAGPFVADMVRTLLTRPPGTPDGLAAGLVADLGRPAFASAVADVLECSPDALEHTLGTVLPDPDHVLLTGAEAVALALRRAGVMAVFGADTDGSPLREAFAALGRFVAADEGRDCLLRAAGAGLSCPGRGAALLRSSRGLADGLGTLEDLRRDGTGVFVLAELPEAADVDGELVRLAGRLGGARHACAAVPGEGRERGAAVDGFVAALRETVRDVLGPPHGPVLLTLPSQALRTAWVPLSALRAALTAVPAPGVPGPLRSLEGTLLTADRLVVLADDRMAAVRGAGAALDAFAHRTGATVLRVGQPWGPAKAEPDGPARLDPASSAHREAVREADLVLALGDGGTRTGTAAEPERGRRVLLTLDPTTAREHARTGPWEAIAVTDPAAALDALARGHTITAPHTAATTPDTAGSAPEQGVDTGSRFADPAPSAPGTAAVAAAVAGAVAGAGGGVLVLDEEGLLGARTAGGVARAVGLALAEPSARVLCCVSPEAFTGGLRHVAAAVRESAPVTFLVCAAAETRTGAPDGRGCVPAAAALGVHTRRTGPDGRTRGEGDGATEEEPRRTLAAAITRPGPALVELLVPEPRHPTGQPPASRTGEENGQVPGPAPVTLGAPHA